MVKIQRSRDSKVLSRLTRGIFNISFLSGGFLVFVVCTFFHSFAKNETNSEEPVTVSSALRSSKEVVRRASLPTVSSSSVIQEGYIPCSVAKERVASGDWADPNHGRIYARETISDPKFRVAVHTEEYDPVRWKSIFETGKYYEEDVHDRFVQVLANRPRSYVLDVGANIGYYTLLSAALGHNVISFEPNPANILRICDSLRLNDWASDDIRIFQNAVSDVHGDEMLLFAPKNPGQGFLKEIDPENSKTDEHQAKTKLVSLDKWAEEHGLFDNDKFSVDVLKVDVEGREPQVFMGASKLLNSGVVRNVLTECRRFGRPNVKEMMTVLFDAGFSLREPSCPSIHARKSPKENAESLIAWAKTTLGPNSMKTMDLWWEKT
mmetsp:Transcript_11254/g.17405  ORF Transcript_11254/g.17405 Transcript_11254/m.17405 type:complete len:378 (+) Transcript_11254:114-1247(+)